MILCVVAMGDGCGDGVVGWLWWPANVAVQYDCLLILVCFDTNVPHLSCSYYSAHAVPVVWDSDEAHISEEYFFSDAT